MPIDLSRYAKEFPSLKFSNEETGILELVMSNQEPLESPPPPRTCTGIWSRFGAASTSMMQCARW